MSINWKEIWEAHPDVFIVRNWQECAEDKRKAWRLPTTFSYFMGGETTLRVGVIAYENIPREEEFLLAGMMWGNRLSNGAKTLIYFVARDFSPFFLDVISKIRGNISARAVYWRERLNPSLYLIPDNLKPNSKPHVLGEERPDWQRWGSQLNPVAGQQLKVVKEFFTSLQNRKIRIEFKSQQISFIWGNYEIAEIKRKGKKFDLVTKTKWIKEKELATQWNKSGWVDISGTLNQEFCKAVFEILDYLEAKEQNAALRPRDLLALWLSDGSGVLNALWGNAWQWPWLPKDRTETWVNDLSELYFFEGSGQLSIVYPILDKPLAEVCHCIILASVLEKSSLLENIKNNEGKGLKWDGRIHWLTLSTYEEDLKLWHCWFKNSKKFPIWLLPENWQVKGLEEVTCRNSEVEDYI